jgi:NAD(P)-dependent dehydrogenase (short-subunit alcohol dehydrogenase family)
MKKLVDKVAVIIGAAEGIGKAIAIRAATEGMKLVLADIDAVKLASTVAALTGYGADVIGVCADVSKAEQVDAMAAQAFSRFGNVHLLVNNAGVAITKPVWETTSQDWDRVMGVNFYGVTNGLRAFIPTMLKNGEEGHIVNTASMAGLLSQPSLAAYNASKHAVVTVSEGLHHDLVLRRARIKVSVLCPLWVKTGIAQAERHRPSGDMSDATAPDAITAKIEEAIFNAVENGISVDQVADAVFDAISLGGFYILDSHEKVMPMIKTRMEDILHQRKPTFARL